MSYLLGAMLLLFGGVGLGFALAKWRRRAAVGIGLLVLAGVSIALLVPRSPGEWTLCRILQRLWTKDEHPFELVGAWVGWDTSHTTPYCRLELEEDGTGRCVFWYGSPLGGQAHTELQRVTRWGFHGSRIDIRLESEKGEERMRGDAYDGLLLLKYAVRHPKFPELEEKWFGPLRLVPEESEEAARRDVAAVLEER